MKRLKSYTLIVLLLFFFMPAIPIKADVKNISYQAEINYPPYKYMNNGHLSGFDIELTNLIFKNEDYNLSFTTDNWDKIYERLKKGDIDTCGFIVVNDERKKDVLFSNPVINSHIAVYTRSDFNKISLNDLDKYSVGVGKAQYPEYILKNNLNISNCKEYIDVEKAVDALASGEIDVLFENQEVVNHYIIIKGLKGTITAQASNLYPQTMAYGVKKSNPELVEYINKRLAQLQKSGVYEELYQNYFFSHSDYYNKQQKKTYIVAVGIAAALLIIVHILLQFYIRYLKKKIYTERMQYEDKLKQQYLELEATYEELTATEEELRAQYDELSISQQLLEESENRYRTILDSTNDGIWEFDINTNRLFISKKYADMLNLEEQSHNNNLLDILNQVFHPEDRANALQKIRELDTIDSSDTLQYECRMKTNTGVYKWFLTKSKALKDKHGKVYKKLGTITDINDLKMYQQRLHYSAFYDTLTGLPNRLYLYEYVSPIIKRTIDAKQNGAFIFIDVDNFKLINDNFGHSTGDVLLEEIAERFTLICPGKNNIIRLGGDEFIIILPKAESAYSVKLLVKNIFDAFNEPFNIEELVVNSTLSIGICMFPQDGENLEILLKNADTAMYKTKNSGRNNFTFYNKSMSENLMDKINLENNLKTALENNEFTLNYQPQLDVQNSKIIGLEALLRWNNPKLGRIPPDKFIPAAEEMGLIIPIGEWVLKTACEFLVKLHNLGFNYLTISVNISIVQLIQPNFPDIVLRILKESGLHPEFLELEITETVLMENIESNTEKLRRLKAIGVRVALDDFGKGYSSLNYLKSLPISTLKIDKSFMDDVLVDSCTEYVVSSIILLGHKMGLKIVAEGIEEEDQLEYLKASECNFLQGYLLSRPLPDEDAISYLISHS